MKICYHCKQEKELDEFYVRKDSPSGRQGICKICMNRAVADRRLLLIKKARESRGGKCEVCGYDKCQQALEFHHTDPSGKEFPLTDGRSRSWERMKKEVDKCILLCANCHREYHYGILDL